MCSICGVLDFGEKFDADLCTVRDMGMSMRHRGVDSSGLFVGAGAMLSHNRLCVIDPISGSQPMSVTYKGCAYTIVYNGEIYNCDELKAELLRHGVKLRTRCDTEIVLYSYIIYGDRCCEKLNGIFAFCVFDESHRRAFLGRDRFGVKPLFYSEIDGQLLFASEIKGILQDKRVSRRVDAAGLWELLYLAPAKLQGSGIFRDIHELKPAEYAVYDANGLKISSYWRLEAEHIEPKKEEAAANVRSLLCDAIKRQLVSDVPLCTFLSGGLDSSVISAVAAEYYREQGETLSTYSFEYEGNRENFSKSLFQPAGDDEYAVFLADWLGTEHTVLTAPTDEVASCLADAVRHRDFPGQADIDSSLLYFCRQVKRRHTVAISGECSDEIFGGYPWFYRPEMLFSGFFPWIHKPQARAGLFRADAIRSQDGFDFISRIYSDSLSSCPLIAGESSEMTVSRQATWLSVQYFMTSLLERKDRMSMASSVEVRVPFADHRILEYVFNVPWEIKFENGVEKALLRNAMSDYLPDKILWRKKSPYPKTHNPEYERIVTGMLRERLARGGQLAGLLDMQAFERMMAGEDSTWFGQLMARPQLIAWLVQLDCWLDEYNVELVI